LIFRLGKVHGSLSSAGKVRAKTPKVEKKEKEKKPKGRAYQRLKIKRRFLESGVVFGKPKSPNSNKK
jgi:small subunit ribosomal protein S30e